MRLFILFGILIVCGVALATRIRTVRPDARRFDKRRFLTPNEVEFFTRLCQAVPELYVFPQVSMGALLAPAATIGREDFLRVRNRFAAKVVDFVIADADLKPMVLIELDDRTHSAERDAQRDAMTREAGYITLRYQSKQKPTVDTIRRDIARARKLSAMRCK